jgi:hypothetical protein
MVATFRALSGLADFEREADSGERAESIGQSDSERAEPALTATRMSAVSAPTVRVPITPHAPTVTINIELSLPATDDATVYENLFAAMKKHLFPQPASDEAE